MLEIALEHKNMFSLVKQRESSASCTSDLEWERLETVVGFLKVFVEVTKTFTKRSGSSCLTANIYFPKICDVHLWLIEWTRSPDGFVSSLAVTMRKRFEEFWNRNHCVPAIATILDPRFKMKLVEYYYPLLYDSAASEFIEDIYEYVKVLYNEHSYINETTTSSPGQDSKSDLEKYLKEPLFPHNSDFDILNWWKVHTPKYPILSMMARNVLAVPMSNVSSEEDAFESSRKRRISETWCSLRPSTVQALMCAQDWIRSELESS
ncbi:zinc finger BED domain-containing protein RICESLEEPER 1-like [Raphanus sativus]|uniref:Zinc finger BED domain-containing protein RICESLEEPER 1-like n=1 Tax=Raphanus sativus TaxID=3726 RepID=A0A9W3CFC5_RAPSA|nr:zinc finger BED domain-containing protein RICESLEEPER 1-like [Raphanus sativus]